MYDLLLENIRNEVCGLARIEFTVEGERLAGYNTLDVGSERFGHRSSSTDYAT